MHTIERIPELAEQARASLAAAGYDDASRSHVGDGTLGMPERAPFAAIAVAAAAPELPRDALRAAPPRGRLVVPVGGPVTQRLEWSCAARKARRGALGPVPLRPAPRGGGVRGEAGPRPVRGRVQGVFFRPRPGRAESLGVAGWVRNTGDGSVEAVFEGPAEHVESLLAWCRRGPAGAQVDDVETADEEPAGESVSESGSGGRRTRR